MKRKSFEGLLSKGFHVNIFYYIREVADKFWESSIMDKNQNNIPDYCQVMRITGEWANTIKQWMEIIPRFRWKHQGASLSQRTRLESSKTPSNNIHQRAVDDSGARIHKKSIFSGEGAREARQRFIVDRNTSKKKYIPNIHQKIIIFCRLKSGFKIVEPKRNSFRRRHILR